MSFLYGHLSPRNAKAHTPSGTCTPFITGTPGRSRAGAAFLPLDGVLDAAMDDLLPLALRPFAL